MSVEQLLSEGISTKQICERLGVTSGDVARVWRACTWMTMLQPPQLDTTLHAGLGELSRLLHFEPVQYAYYSHSADLRDSLSGLESMLADPKLVGVINERKLSHSGREMVCFTTKLDDGRTLPVWSFTVVVQYCLGGPGYPTNPNFKTLRNEFRARRKVEKRNMEDRSKPPVQRSQGVGSGDAPISCGTCDKSFYIIGKLRKHATDHGHQLPTQFMRKDAWLDGLLESDRFQVCTIVMAWFASDRLIAFPVTRFTYAWFEMLETAPKYSLSIDYGASLIGF